MEMSDQIRINTVDVRDYINLRKRGLNRFAAFDEVRSLNMPMGCTFLQLLSKFDSECDIDWPPSMEALKFAEKEIDRCIGTMEE